MTSRSEVVFFDSNIYINIFRYPLYERRIEKLLQGAYQFVVSHIVLMELWAGAQTSVEKNILESQQNHFRLIGLSNERFIAAGRILNQMKVFFSQTGEDRRRRKLTWDLLIALSAQENNALLVTENRDDFQKIRRFVDFEFMTP